MMRFWVGPHFQVVSLLSTMRARPRAIPARACAPRFINVARDGCPGCRAVGVGAVLAAVFLAFVLGALLGMALRLYWLWFLNSAISAAVGAVLAAVLLWWLGADLSTVRLPDLSSVDPLTASLAANVALAFLMGLWVGYHVLARRVGVLAGAWSPPGR